MRTLVLDKNGKQLDYVDLFTRTDGLWKFLSGYSIAAFTRQLGYANPSWAQGDLAPKADSFKHFVVTPQGLALFFDDYQVASYGAGEQSCDIPLKALAKFAPKPGFWK